MIKNIILLPHQQFYMAGQHLFLFFIFSNRRKERNWIISEKTMGEE